MKKKHFKIPIYGGRLTIIKTKDLLAIVEKYGLNESAAECSAFVFKKPNDKGRLMLYAVFKRKNLDIIAHEAVHIVNYIFEFKSVQPDVLNDETQAYLTGWAFRKIHKTIRK